MTTINFGDLVNQAAEQGFVNEILPDGEYTVEVADRNAGTSQGNKPQIGVRFKIIAGPHAGKSFWDNLTLTEENPKAVAVFIRKLGQLGVSSDFLKVQTSMDAVAAAIQVGAQYTATLGHRAFNGKTYQDVKKIVALSTPVAAPVSQPVVAPQPTNGQTPVAAAAPPF